MNAQEHTPPKDNGTASREEILRAAAEIFMEYGYAATSIDAVAERLGATKGRIYHHYPSKADLFFEVQIAAMKRMPPKSKPLLAATRAPTKANAKVETRSRPKTKSSRSTSWAYFLRAKRASRRIFCSFGSGTGTAEIKRLV